MKMKSVLIQIHKISNEYKDFLETSFKLIWN